MADSSPHASPQTWREFAGWAVRHPGDVFGLIGVLVLLAPGLIKKWKRGGFRD